MSPVEKSIREGGAIRLSARPPRLLTLLNFVELLVGNADSEDARPAVFPKLLDLILIGCVVRDAAARFCRHR